MCDCSREIVGSTGLPWSGPLQGQFLHTKLVLEGSLLPFRYADRTKETDHTR